MLEVIYFISRSVSNDRTQGLKSEKNFKTKILVYFKNALAEISWHILQVCELVFNSRQKQELTVLLS